MKTMIATLKNLLNTARMYRDEIDAMDPMLYSPIYDTLTYL